MREGHACFSRNRKAEIRGHGQILRECTQGREISIIIFVIFYGLLLQLEIIVLFWFGSMLSSLCWFTLDSTRNWGWRRGADSFFFWLALGKCLVYEEVRTNGFCNSIQKTWKNSFGQPQYPWWLSTILAFCYPNSLHPAFLAPQHL